MELCANTNSIIVEVLTKYNSLFNFSMHGSHDLVLVQPCNASFNFVKMFLSWYDLVFLVVKLTIFIKNALNINIILWRQHK
jgi:hypothetical protein